MVWSFGFAAALIGPADRRHIESAGYDVLSILLCGITGDTLGATNEVIEISFLLFMPFLTYLP